MTGSFERLDLPAPCPSCGGDGGCATRRRSSPSSVTPVHCTRRPAFRQGSSRATTARRCRQSRTATSGQSTASSPTASAGTVRDGSTCRSSRGSPRRRPGRPRGVSRLVRRVPRGVLPVSTLRGRAHRRPRHRAGRPPDGRQLLLRPRGRHPGRLVVGTGRLAPRPGPRPRARPAPGDCDIHRRR